MKMMKTDCRNITGIETRKGSGAEIEGLMTNIEVGLADILEIKPGSRVVGSQKCWNYILQRRIETEGEHGQGTTKKDRDAKTETKS